jgi:tripartite-type tricarboxylate transporter receptor subunit TctC
MAAFVPSAGKHSRHKTGIAVVGAKSGRIPHVSGALRLVIRIPGGSTMKLPRRKFLHLAAGAVALPAVSRFAWAQTYPTRPVRIIVPAAAGGQNDILARLMGQWLSERLGQPVIIDNRPGAGQNIGTEAVVRAPPDGYTLLMVGVPNAINASLYDKLNFNFIRDIAPIATLIHGPLVMVVNPSVPAKTVPEFIAYAKANPRKINMASAGNGTTSHVAGEKFKMMAGVDMAHVPYRGGGPALTDLLGGQVQVSFVSMIASIEYIRADKLRPLGVTTTTRLEALPDISTVGEYVPGYEASAWLGIAAPKNTPAGVIDRLNTEINAGLADPKIKARLADLGGTVFSSSPAEFSQFIAAEIQNWGKVIRETNIKAE